MRKLPLALAFIILFVLANNAQTPTPTVVPIEDDDVVKISTTLIQVDVTVTDKNGKIIRDLKPEDFEIYENKEKQTITNFSFVATAPEAAETVAATKKPEKNAVPLPPVPVKAANVRRTIALVVDDLGLSFESIYFVRRALRKFVDEQMQPNDLVAIIRTGSGVGALQQFTTDKRQLYAAIEAVKWNSIGRGGISAFAPLQATSTEIEESTSMSGGLEADSSEAGSGQSLDAFREDVFSIGTLGAINFIVKGMNDLPGRKSIMLFSDGFTLCPSGDPDRCSRLVDAVRRLTDLSNRAAVSIYSFDARGLQTTGLTAADNTNGVSAERIRNLSSTRSAELFDKQQGLAYLADETGGRAFFNNNDFNKGLDKALEDQRGYYLIGYQPDDETFDPAKKRFNKLEVKVKIKGASVRYRSGFFGVADDAVQKPTTQNSAQQIYTALTSPFAVSDVALSLNTLFANDKTQGSFVRSLLHVNARDLKFTDEADGKKKAVFDVLAVSFGANGAVVDQINKTYTWTIKNEVYQKLLDEGFVYHFTFPVKNPGAYQYRVAIRDTQTGKVGSANQFIEIPNLKKNRLTVSSLVLENLTDEQWKNINDASSPTDAPEPRGSGTSMSDTSLRRFKRGTILRYGYEIYNAKLDQSQKPNLLTQVRVFRDGKLVLEGKNIPLDLLNQTDLQRVKTAGAISLGDTLQPGDYVMQIVVTDNLAKGKNRIATQFVQFEIQ